MIGLQINQRIGIGDAIQFSSLPENYYYHTGQKLIDMNKHWFFDDNPYIERDKKPYKVFEMWNFPIKWPWPNPRKQGVYLSNAEIWASVLDVPVVLNRPRIYRYENFPFEKRENIIIHIDGKSNGIMPKEIVDHVVHKYAPTGKLIQIGTNLENVGIHGIKHVRTHTLWDLAELISSSRMFIGVDSGPSWIAACYPDVVLKKIRTKPSSDVFRSWVPLQVENIHSHWDDRCHQVFNTTDHDIGFTYSYRRI